VAREDLSPANVFYAEKLQKDADTLLRIRQARNPFTPLVQRTGKVFTPVYPLMSKNGCINSERCMPLEQ
jgi:hypothetical protein